MKKSFVMSCLIGLISFQMQAGLGRLLVSGISFAGSYVIGKDVLQELQKEDIKKQVEEVKAPFVQVIGDLKEKQTLNKAELQKLAINSKEFAYQNSTLVIKGAAAGILSGFGLKNILCHHK